MKQHLKYLIYGVEFCFSDDTSKEDTFMRADQATGQIVEVNSCPVSVSPEKHFHSHIDSLEFIDENVTEIDHMERLETEDSIKVSKEKVIKVCAEKSMEISMIQLPTANISLPRDISQHELSVPRARLSDATHKDSDAISIVSTKSETKFPELLIPEWKKTSQKGRLVQISSFDSEGEFRPADKIENLRIDSTDSERHLMSYDGNYSDEHSASKSMEDAEGSSLEQDVFYDQPHYIESLKLAHSAPASQSGTLESIEKSASIYSMQSPSSLSPLLAKRSTHPPAHWPRVRPVSSANRIKPATELLEESRRYRQGQSSYTARIKRKYALSDDPAKFLSQIKDLNKENIKEGYVKAIVKRLSRESTPDYNKRINEISATTLGSFTVNKTDSPRAKSEFVQQIVRKLSSPHGPELNRGIPLADLTNGSGAKVKLLAEVYSTRSTPDRVSSDTECRYKSVLLTSKPVTREIRDSLYDSSSTLTNSQSLLTAPDTCSQGYSNVTTSMPLIAVVEEGENSSHNGYRERAATTATCDTNDSPTMERQEIHLALSSPGKLDKSQATHVSNKSIPPKSKGQKKVEISFPVKTSQKSGGKAKMGTIGVLCQQSMMSFDLGLSLQASEQDAVKRDKGDNSQKARPLSTGSIEGVASTSTDTRRRSRMRFFESRWLQKKFFKVSK